MNKMNIKKMARTRLATSRLGRALVRFTGEESGQTAMEYVVIATLICAAIAVGVWLFGAQILSMIQIAGETLVTKHDTAIEHAEKQRNNTPAVNSVGTDANNALTEGGRRGDNPSNNNQ